MKKIRISKVGSNFEREPLIPYNFKGGATTDKWVALACLVSENGHRVIGQGPQGTLWSDAAVARSHSEAGANVLMFAISEYALQMLVGESFTSPIQLIDDIFPDVYEYAKKITNLPNLKKTFVLNSLVCVDNAAWLLYAAENNIENFDDLIPIQYRNGLSEKHDGVASIPSFPVGTGMEQIQDLVNQGHFILKLKIGAAGNQSEMLEKDKAFVSKLYKVVKNVYTPHTSNGKIQWYLDANGRYENKELLLRFIDHAQKIGALDHFAIIEEPFSGNYDAHVGGLGVRIAADESVETPEDVASKIEQGYTAFALKAIAKTLSKTMKVAELAYQNEIPCFCADLTCNPILVEWNKNVAARLPLFPGTKVGLQETNGHQYFRNWDRLMSYHPMPDGEWVRSANGVYSTGKSFYKHSGGIFKPSNHYEQIFDQL